MSAGEKEKKVFFDLHVHGVGYLGRIREVTPNEGNPFLSVSLSALWGPIDNARYTHFECIVSGLQTQALVRELQPAVDGNKKVLAGFTLSDLHADTFTFQTGDRAGQTGIRLRSRLLRLSWVRVEGEPFYAPDRKVAAV